MTVRAVECTGRLLNVAARRARGLLDAALADAGVSFAGFLTLAELERSGPVMQRELADAVGVEAPTLTRQLDRLAAEGLVARDAGDSRRANRVRLTEQGADLLARVDALVLAADHELQTRLNREERDQLRVLLRKLA